MRPVSERMNRIGTLLKGWVFQQPYQQFLIWCLKHLPHPQSFAIGLHRRQRLF